MILWKYEEKRFCSLYLTICKIRLAFQRILLLLDFTKKSANQPSCIQFKLIAPNDFGFIP